MFVNDIKKPLNLYDWKEINNYSSHGYPNYVLKILLHLTLRKFITILTSYVLRLFYMRYSANS